MKVPEEIAKSLPEFPDFQDISLESQAAVGWFFAQYAPVISEYTFTNLFIWRLSRPIKLALLDDHLWDLYGAGKITIEEMLDKARDPGGMLEKAQQKGDGLADDVKKKLDEMGPVLGS